MDSAYYKKCLVCGVKDKEKELRCNKCSGKLPDVQRLLIEAYESRIKDMSSKRAFILTFVSPFVAFAFFYLVLNALIFIVGKIGLDITPISFRKAFILSTLFVGAGHLYLKRYIPALFFAVQLPLSIGLLWQTFSERDMSFMEIMYNNDFNYGVIALLFVYIEIWLIVAKDTLKWRCELKKAPCQLACPAGIDIPHYIALISEGKYNEAINIIRENNPLPATIGRVCPHQCEIDCLRGVDGEPIAINPLKRFVSDFEREINKTPPKFEVLPGKNEKVAIIGSGPAGLSAAFYLAKLGVMSTIYEKAEVAGGMLALGIPKYRLPRDVLNYEIDLIKGLGVNIVTNSPLGTDEKSMTSLLKEGYDAVLLAVGVQQGIKLRIKGEESDGVLDCLSYLQEANLKEPKVIGSKVVVIGGGNAAVDAARTLLRLGAETVILLYRRGRNEMPASKNEVAAAEQEGVVLEFLAAPKEIISDETKVVAMQCVKMRLGEPDKSGRRRPIPIEGSEFTIETDKVIAAIGQTLKPDFVTYNEDIKFTDRHLLKVDKVSLETSIKGVYSAGDCVSGPSTAINAIAMGKRAALSIFYDLYNNKIRWPEYKDNYTKKCEIIAEERAVKKLRIRMPSMPLKERIYTSGEVEKGYSEGMALEESLRCLKCHQELIE